MEAEKAKIERTIYLKPPEGFSQVQELSQRLVELNHAIETSTERWLKLAELQ